MTLEFAQKLASDYLGKQVLLAEDGTDHFSGKADWDKGTVTVTSDGGVFVGNSVEFMTAYAKEHGHELFIIRNEDAEPEKEIKVPKKSK